MSRLEAVAVRRYEDRDGNEKAAFTNIGVAWPMKDRDGYTLRLHAVPAPEEGEYTILLMPPKDKDDRDDRRGGGGRQERSREERPSQKASRESHQRPFSRDMDDDIPF